MREYTSQWYKRAKKLRHVILTGRFAGWKCRIIGNVGDMLKVSPENMPATILTLARADIVKISTSDLILNREKREKLQHAEKQPKPILRKPTEPESRNLTLSEISSLKQTVADFRPVAPTERKLKELHLDETIDSTGKARVRGALLVFTTCEVYYSMGGRFVVNASLRGPRKPIAYNEELRAMLSMSGPAVAVNGGPKNFLESYSDGGELNGGKNFAMDVLEVVWEIRQELTKQGRLPL